MPTSTPSVSGCGGVNIGGLCVNTFTPYMGLAKYGLISMLSRVFTYLFLVLGVFWVITILLAVFDYIRSEGKTETIEHGWLSIQNIWRVLSIILIGFIIIMMIGVMMGAGNPFEWPDNFSQCGEGYRNEMYMNARDSFFTSGVVSSGTSINIYCCKNSDPAGDGWFVGVPAGFENSCELFKTEVVP